MATFDNLEIVRDLIANNGKYYDDPQVLAIYEYTNDWGKQCWMVGYDTADIHAMIASPYVHYPELLWSQDTGKLRDPLQENLK